MIKDEKVPVAIFGGCGHIGLPLGLTLADIGYQVSLYDINEQTIEMINAGQMPFLEEGAEELLQKHIGKNVIATKDSNSLSMAQIVVSVIGTPVDEHLNPTTHQFLTNMEEILEKISDNSLLILRSTIFPGVTKLLYEKTKKYSKKIHLAFCPERIAEGKAIEEIKKLPQIISAYESEALSKARNLFEKIALKIIELEPLEAELAKLFCNSWRYLNFAISNQFYMLAENYGLDFYHIHDAITLDYPRMKSFAKAGFAAGPCLLKDTIQLSTFAGNNFFMGHAAMLINEGLPNFIINQLGAAKLANANVAVLGMAFKGDSDDSRESLSYKLCKLLEIYSKHVYRTDPYIKKPSFVSLEEAISKSDIIILGAPHSVYKNLEIPKEKTVIDIWGFWRNLK
ncbi:MAG: nucleotide sugar dehydrogenase [Acidobacteria bacterium]|nr:nucleotide sugar dehydrogenase [Acidobacteriota bacterium]